MVGGGPRRAVPHSGDEDPELLRQFAHFYRNFAPRLYAFLLVAGSSERETVDIVHITMTHLLRNWREVREREIWSRSKAWELRAQGPRLDDIEMLEASMILADVGDRPVWEDRHDILRHLKALTRPERDCVAWRLEGYTAPRIATELRLATEVVEADLRTALRKLRRSMQLPEDDR
jgi:DNA-directed RNA polymerase specialized sigma24 family protein